MKEILEKLFNNDLDLSLILLEAKSIAEEIGENDLVEYLEKEIGGYKVDDNVPDYRKVQSQIVADIRDVYGNELFKERPVDFSKLSEQLGMDLDLAYIPDGISFVENSIKGLSGNMAIKPFPKPLVKMLDETFNYNNPELHITGAYHKIPTAYLNYILTRVRQDMIVIFQKLLKKNNQDEIKIEKVESEKDSAMSKKKIFVTYAWGNEDFNDKIISFVNFLREKGFDAFMDKKNSQEETSIDFNKMMIEGIQNSDKVIVVLSKEYKIKADDFKGGVGTEYKIILEDMKRMTKKYILVSFGTDQVSEISPTGFLGRNVLNLKKDQDENGFNDLFAKIKEENIVEFIDVNEKEIEVVKKEIKPFKL